MKKKALFLIIVFLVSISIINIKPLNNIILKDILNYKDANDTGFDDSKFFECLYDVYTNKRNTSYDNVSLTDAQLAALTTTGDYCKDRNITSIQGTRLSKLTGLKTLDLSNTDDTDSNNNNIASINTSVLTALTTLNLNGVGLISYNGNENGANITILDLSNNKLNKTGYISKDTDSKIVTFSLNNNNLGNPRLATLDLSKDTLLRTVNIKDNNIISSIVLPNTMTGNKAVINIEISGNKRLSNLTLPKTITTTNNGTSAYYAPTISILNNGQLLTDKAIIDMPEIINSGGAKPIITLEGNAKVEDLVMPTINTTQTPSTAEVKINNNNDLKTIDLTNESLLPNLTIDGNKNLNTITMASDIVTTSATTYKIENNGTEGLLNLNLPQTFKNSAALELTINGNNINTINIPNILMGKAASVVINIKNNKKLNTINRKDDVIAQTSPITIDIEDNTGEGDSKSISIPYSAGTMNLTISRNDTKTINLSRDETTVSKIINLDISNNKQLETLTLPQKLNAGAASTFTIKGNEKLTTVNLPIATDQNLVATVQDNGLTSIDTSKATRLTELYVNNTDSTKEWNKLTELDLSNNVNITKVDASNNKLATINLNSATSTKITKLTELKASNNKLINMNLTENTGLITIDLSKNLLENIKLPIPGTKVLKYLSLQNNKLTTSNIENLSANNVLLELNVSDNDLNSTCLDADNNNAYADGICPSGAAENTIPIVASLKKFTMKNNRGDLKTIKIPASSALTNLELEKNTSLVSVSGLGNAASIANLVIKENSNLSNDLVLPVGNTGAIANLSKNKLKKVTVNGTSSVNKFVEIDLSDNELDTFVNANYLTLVNKLDLHNNKLTEFTTNSATLTNLNIEETNNFKHQIAMYVGESVDVTGKNPIIITKPTGKTITLKGLSTTDSNLTIADEKNVTSNKVGDYTTIANYTHDINAENNTFKVVNDIHVVSIEGNNDRYETFSVDGNQYLYIRNYNTTTDANANIVGNLKINGSSSYISISTPTTSNKKTTMNVTEEGGDKRALPTFTVIGLYSTDTSKFVIEKNGILVFNTTFDLSKIKIADATSSGMSLSLNEAGNELSIKNGNTVIKKLQIIIVNSTKYSTYLTKGYIFDNSFSLSNLTIDNGNNSITYKENCGTEKEKCEILNIKNKSGDVVRSYDIVKISSDKYIITNDYILGLNNEFDTVNLNPRAGKVELNDETNPTLLTLKYDEEIVNKFDIGVVIAPYDLTKTYIITKASDYDSIGYRLDDLFVYKYKADVVPNDASDKIMIKVNNRLAKEYDIVKPTALSLGSDFEMLKNNTKQLVPVFNENSSYTSTSDLDFTSSNDEVVTVSDSGLVTGVSAGSAVITAKTRDEIESDRISATVVVTVYNSIKLTFKDGDEIFKEENYAEGISIDLDAREKEGYTLIGYSDGIDTHSINNKYVVPTQDTVLSTVWQINKYKLNVNLNGGSSSQTFNSEYDYNSNIELIPPKKVGYTFVNWELDSESNALLSGDNLTIKTSDTSIEAIWIANKYKVVYNANGGTTAEPYKTVTYDSMYGVLDIPTKVGNTFKGWYLDEDFTDEVKSATIVTKTEDHTLYAKWTPNQYAVSFSAPGATIDLGGASQITVTYGGTYPKLPTATYNAQINPNMTFVGWYTEQTGGTKIVQGSPVTINDNHTLYARFDDTITYNTVTYNSNGGSSCANESVKTGTQIGTMCVPTKSNYTFDGWYKEETFENLVNEETVITEDINIYAKWKYKPKLIIELNGGVTNQAFSERYNENDEIVLIEPTKENSRFDKWIIDSNSDSRLDGNKLIIGTKDTTLTAKYLPNYVEVSFDPSQGCNNKVVTLGETYGELCVPVKTNYLFIDWYTGKTDGTRVTKYTKVTNPNNHTLYARFESIIDKVNNNSTYELTENEINNVKPNTSIASNLGFVGITTKIYSGNTLKTTGYMATGDVVKAYQNDKVVGSYTIIIKGDVIGNGKVTVADVAKLYQFAKGKITLGEVFIKAGNVVSSDNVIKVNDVAKLYQFVKGKIKEL